MVPSRIMVLNSPRDTQRCCMSCSSSSRSGSPSVSPVARYTWNPWLDVPCELCRKPSSVSWPAALREGPGPAPHRIAILLDQAEPARIGRDDQREVGLVDDRVDAAAAVPA